jgi:hypothetical protein
MVGLFVVEYLLVLLFIILEFIVFIWGIDIFFTVFAYFSQILTLLT